MTYEEFCNKTSKLSEKDQEVLLCSLKELSEIYSQLSARLEMDGNHQHPITMTYKELSEMEKNAHIVQYFTQPWHVGLDDHSCGFTRFVGER